MKKNKLKPYVCTKQNCEESIMCYFCTWCYVKLKKTLDIPIHTKQNCDEQHLLPVAATVFSQWKVKLYNEQAYKWFTLCWLAVHGIAMI